MDIKTLNIEKIKRPQVHCMKYASLSHNYLNRERERERERITKLKTSLKSQEV